MKKDLIVHLVKVNKDKKEKGGRPVKPGTYKVILSYGDSTDQTTVQVKSDPRYEVSMAAINEVYEGI